MTDLSARPGAPASSPTSRRLLAAGFVRRTSVNARIAELHRLHLGDQHEAARRSVDRAFTAVAAFLAAERGEGQ